MRCLNEVASGFRSVLKSVARPRLSMLDTALTGLTVGSWLHSHSVVETLIVFVAAALLSNVLTQIADHV